MNIIFLDIDGVLNQHGEHPTEERHHGYMGLDETLVTRFLGLLERLPDVKIVLSSTWRLYPEMKSHVEARIALLDYTPWLKDQIRGWEIETWLMEHQDVEAYAILDDDKDFLEGQPLFRTDSAIGLTDEIVEAVVAHFGGN